MFTVEKLKSILIALTEKRHFCVAYSGGLDSHVLLNAMAILCRENNWHCRAIHINHGVNSAATAWESHCRDVAAALAVPFETYKINFEKNAQQGLEAALRRARYEKFQEKLNKHECLLTAHHADDQLETVLLKLFRGAGVQGLSGISPKKLLNQIELLRPLLMFEREQLKLYATTRQLKWIEDNSNMDVRFNRNFLRHNIIPLLKTRWPMLSAIVNQSAEHCAQATELLQWLGATDLKTVEIADNIISSEKLSHLPMPRRYNVMREWIHQQGYPLPSQRQFHELDRQMQSASADAKPLQQWDAMEVRRYQQALYLKKRNIPFLQTNKFSWNLQTPFTLPMNLGVLVCHLEKGQGFTTLLDKQNITIRFRQGGERMRPLGRAHSQSLKKLFQEWQVPPWQRDIIPLLYYRDELIAVIGYSVAAQYSVSPEDMGYSISTQN